MESLVVLTTLVATSLAMPIVKTWTLNELSIAVETKSDEAMQPYLEDALNQIMLAMFTGKEEEVIALLPSPTGGKTWTMAQMNKAIDDPETNPNDKINIMAARQRLIYMHNEGKHQNSIEVTEPALDVSVWTITDVQEAKKDPKTKPALQPFLKIAEEKIQEALNKGEKKENVRVILVTPVGLAPLKSGTVPHLIPRSS